MGNVAAALRFCVWRLLCRDMGSPNPRLLLAACTHDLQVTFQTFLEWSLHAKQSPRASYLLKVTLSPSRLWGETL